MIPDAQGIVKGKPDGAGWLLGGAVAWSWLWLLGFGCWVSLGASRRGETDYDLVKSQGSLVVRSGEIIRVEALVRSLLQALDQSRILRLPIRRT